MSQSLWERRPPPPQTVGTATGWDRELSTPMSVTVFRGELPDALVRADPACGADREDVDRLLLALEELASNGLRHGRPPVRVRVVPTSDGWLLDVTDAGVDREPTPAVDRDPFG